MPTPRKQVKRFQPSVYSEPFSGELGSGRDVAAGTATALSAGATGLKLATIASGAGGAAAAAGAGGAAAAGGASAAGGLMAAAGVSATVPVAGWIVGGVLAATAGTIALVGGIRKRKLSKKKAIRWAKKLGLPDPKSVPGFVLKLSKKPRSWRMRKLGTYKQRLRKVKLRQKKWRKRPGGRRTAQVFTFGIMRGPQRLKRQRARLESKVALIEALNASYRRRARRRKQTRAEQAQMRQMQAQTQAQAQAQSAAQTRAQQGIQPWHWAAAVVAVGTTVVVLKSRQARARNKKKADL